MSATHEMLQQEKENAEHFYAHTNRRVMRGPVPMLLTELKKIFNRIIALEQFPVSLNEGLIIPVHKGNGKDTFKPERYRELPSHLSSLNSLESSFFNAYHQLLKKRVCPTCPDGLSEGHLMWGCNAGSTTDTCT